MAKRSKRRKRHHPQDRNGAEVSYYFCALLDILGQGERLREINRLSLLTDRDAIGKRLKKTWGLVEHLRESLQTMREAAVKPTPPPSPEIPAEKWRQVKTFDFSTMSFSDLVCLFGSLADTTKNVPIWGLWHAMTTLAGQMLVHLSIGVPLRGAIAVSTGWEIATAIPHPTKGFTMDPCPYHRELYGPALYLSHCLESEAAQYPRIIVDDSTLEYIRAAAGGVRDWRAPVFRRASQLCLDLVDKDTDGFHILDYLGAGHRQQVLTDPTVQDVVAERVGEARRFVLTTQREMCAKLTAATAAKNADLVARYRKLSTRYGRLVNYFERKLPHWPEVSQGSSVEDCQI